MARAHAYAADPANKAEVVAAFAAYQDQPVQMNSDLYENYVFDLTIDDQFLSDVNAVVDYLLSVGRIKSGMDATEFVYTDALKKVDSSLVTAEGAWQP